MHFRPATAITLALSLLICCGLPSASHGQGPEKHQVVEVAVATVALVAAAIIIPIEISKSHHTLKGCILSTPSGLELRTTDNKTYALSGATANLAPGSTVRLHGDRQKHAKNSPDDQIFLVQKMQKNYGPCQALAATASPSHP